MYLAVLCWAKSSVPVVETCCIHVCRVIANAPLFGNSMRHQWQLTENYNIILLEVLLADNDLQGLTFLYGCAYAKSAQTPPLLWCIYNTYVRTYVKIILDNNRIL